MFTNGCNVLVSYDDPDLSHEEELPAAAAS